MEKGHEQHLEIQAQLLIDLDTFLKSGRDISKFASLVREVVDNMLSSCCESTLIIYCAILSEIMRHGTNDDKFEECRNKFLSWHDSVIANSSLPSNEDKEIN